MTEHTRRPLRGYLLALMSAACWAFGGVMAKWLFTDPSAATAGWPLPPLGIDVAPTQLSAGRAIAAFTIMLLVVVAFDRQHLKVTSRSLPFLAAFGIGGLALVHFTYFKTISLTGVATAILLEYLAPVLVLIVSVLFLGHRFSWVLPVGVVLSITGCALVVGAFSDTMRISTEGLLWGLSSAVFFGGYSLMGSVAVGRFSPQTMLVYGLGFASLFWLVILGPVPVVELFSRVDTSIAVLLLALISTIIPFGAFLVALRHIAPTNATVTSTLEPVIAGVAAFVLLGEALGISQILGGLLVIAAILIIQLSERSSAATGMPVQD